MLRSLRTPRALLALALLALAGCALPQREARARLSVERYDAETFFATTSIFGASFSHDGKRLLISSDESGVFNAYSLPVGGGEPHALTHSTTDAVFSRGWFPGDDRFLYTSDQGGNELNHLYVGAAGAEPVDLTPGENLKAGFYGWARDERSFFVSTNERDPQFFDLYRYHLQPEGVVEAGAGRQPVAPGFTRELIFQNDGYDLGDVDPDGRWVALTKTRSNRDSDVYVTRIGTDERIHVTPHEGDVQHGVATFSPDGATLYYLSNAGSEFARVWSYDLASGRHEVAFEDDWDVQFYSFSRDGRYLVTGVNADARTEVRVFEASSEQELELPAVPAGDISGVNFEHDGHRMAFYVNGDTSPSNLFVLDLSSGAYEQLTDTLDEAIDGDALVEATVVRYESFDGLEIPALLYRPQEATPGDRVPALVWVHGGPGGQSRKGYRAPIQHLVNHGYAVLAVNNRGSSGYGKSFHHLDDKRHGDVDLQDCIWGRRYLEGLPWVDGERVGIIGGSYGGYMVCAALAFAPDAFEVGVDIFGVTNWLRTLESIPPWWEEFRKALYDEMGDPETDRERLHAKSPLFHAANITKPLLVVQGANDPRVLQAESDEMVAAVRANGVPVEYVLFPDEGHGFRSKQNRIRASNAYVTFLDEHLKNADVGAAE